MAATKLKVRDRVRILGYPGIWSSASGGSCPKDAKYPIEGEIESINTKYGDTAIKVLGYGFDLGIILNKGLIEMLEPIQAQKWYVGQEVWDDVFFPGEVGRVISIHNDIVEVEFPTSYPRYRNDGTKNTEYKPTLSAVPYTFQLPPQPEPVWIPEKWERVLVRDSNGSKWTALVFVEYKEGNYYAGTDDMRWNQCVPFDENKVGKV